MKDNGTINVLDNIYNVLCNFLHYLKVRRNQYSILKDIQSYFTSTNTVLKSMRDILKFWSIENNVLFFDIENIKVLPVPSIIILKNNSDTNSIANFSIFLGTFGDKIKIWNNLKGEYCISKSSLSSIWTGIVLVINSEKLNDEDNFLEKLNYYASKKKSDEGVSVIMPIYNQSSFAKASINSLIKQSFTKWELILINDNSQDDFEIKFFESFNDSRIKYYKNDKNEGLGYCLNLGIGYSKYNIISYLPADDLYFNNHLETMRDALLATESQLVFSGVKHNSSNLSNDQHLSYSYGKLHNYTYQLAQIMHVKTSDKWLERNQLVTDDLYRMYWHHFFENSKDTLGTYDITCEWTDHSKQRHKIINDKFGGGIYLYKRFFNVSEPIRFQSSSGNRIDEIDYYKDFRNNTLSIMNSESPLKILLVGELAYNAERICALEKKGHKLFGLWIDNPSNFNTVGPLPFGNVVDIPLNDYQSHIDNIKPDIIYALLNFKAVPLAYDVLLRNPHIPFVWHFKEGPFFCRAYDTWEQLIFLYEKSDGQIYINELSQKWFEQYVNYKNKEVLILDGDLPSKEWFSGTRSDLLSEKDGEIHTVVAGRPMGLGLNNILTLLNNKIHIHFYGDVFHEQFKEFITISKSIAPSFVHLHSNCPPQSWVSEFSKYDAGWLHNFESNNFSDISKVSWDDLNLPARMSTYAVAGLPMLMKDNNKHFVASQILLKKFNMGLYYNSFEAINEVFDDKNLLQSVRDNAWENRFFFSFDYYIDELLLFFRRVIKKKVV